MKLSIIVPVYNEINYLERFTKFQTGILAPKQKEIDDITSSDEYRKLVEKEGFKKYKTAALTEDEKKKYDAFQKKIVAIQNEMFWLEMDWMQSYGRGSDMHKGVDIAKFRKISKEGVKFQSHIDGSTHILTPENIVDSQNIINSNIQMSLDECLHYPASFEDSKKSMRLSLNWAERARRRFSQNSEENPYSKVLKDLKERDNSDMSRKFSPLKVPQNALIINTEEKNIHQVSDEIIEKINNEYS